MIVTGTASKTIFNVTIIWGIFSFTRMETPRDILSSSLKTHRQRIMFKN